MEGNIHPLPLTKRRRKREEVKQAGPLLTAAQVKLLGLLRSGTQVKDAADARRPASEDGDVELGEDGDLALGLGDGPGVRALGGH